MTTQPDVNHHATHTSNIADRFLKMECDDSNENGDSLEI